MLEVLLDVIEVFVSEGIEKIVNFFSKKRAKKKQEKSRLF
jgi:hypothetical protein